MRTERRPNTQPTARSPRSPWPTVYIAERSMTPAIEHLAAERGCLQRAGQERQPRPQRALRRAARKERTDDNERRPIQAWCRGCCRYCGSYEDCT
jgi:hypothetical protein